MSGTPAGGGNSQPHFERHGESWGTAGELNSTEVVEGIPARREQFEDAIEPPCGTRDLECGPRAEPEGAETGDQRDEQLFVAGIVRDVEKSVLRGVSLRDRSGSVRRSPPRSGPLLRLSLVVTDQGIGDHRPELTVALGRDAEDAGRRSRCRVRRCDHRAGSQSHGLTLRCEIFVSTCPKGYVQCRQHREGARDSASGRSRRRRSDTDDSGRHSRNDRPVSWSGSRCYDSSGIRLLEGSPDPSKRIAIQRELVNRERHQGLSTEEIVDILVANVPTKRARGEIARQWCEALGLTEKEAKRLAG